MKTIIFSTINIWILKWSKSLLCIIESIGFIMYVKGKHLVISLTPWFLIFLQLTIVDKYASSWRQEIKSKKGSGLKRFRPSSDWQIEEFKGTCDFKKVSDWPTESFCPVVFLKSYVKGASFLVTNIGVTHNNPNNCWEEGYHPNPPCFKGKISGY